MGFIIYRASIDFVGTNISISATRILFKADSSDSCTFMYSRCVVTSIRALLLSFDNTD